MRRVIAVIVCAVIGLLGTSAVVRADGPSVVRIDVEGTLRIENDAVLAKMQTREGDELNEAVLNSDLRAIFNTGYFYDVKIDRRYVEGGVALTVIVTEKPAVKEYEFVGNEHLSTDKITEAVELKPNTILSDARIQEAINKIKQMYELDGYFMVDIDYRTEELPRNRVKVIIEISEYKKVFIKRINFIGNRAVDDDTLKGLIMTKEGNAWSSLSSKGIYQPEMFLNDINIMRSYYLDRGYLAIKIDEPLVTLAPDKRSMFLTVNIEEGPQYYVGKLDIEGDLLFEKERLMELFTFKTGDLYSTSALQKTVEDIRNEYKDIGYAFAEVTPDTQPDPATRIIDITLRVNRGKLVYFENIRFEGNTSTRDKVIRRELYVTEGDLYSGPGIRKSKERLLRLGYFDEVAISTDRGSNDEAVDLVIRVKERQQGSFVVGVGFSSVENFVGTATISHNNLFGYGTKLSLDAQIGRFQKNFTLRVREPYLLDTQYIGSISLVNAERSFLQFDRFDNAATIGLGRRLHWDVEGHLSYRYQSVDIKNVQNQAALSLTRQEGNTLTTSLSYRLVRDTVNSPFDPTDGSRVGLGIEWADEAFGGELEFIKYSGEARKYFPLVWDTAFMLHGEGGYGFMLDGSDLHISERYFLGGINSVRGFGRERLGPTEETLIPTNAADPSTTLTNVESVIGGDKYLQGNAELLIPIVKDLNIKGVLFYDIGNALPEGQWFAYDGFRQAWGFGVRWISPIGPLRFEWGHPLFPQDGERTQVFEFGIGTFF